MFLSIGKCIWVELVFVVRVQVILIFKRQKRKKKIMKTSCSVVREPLVIVLCMAINLTVQRQDDSYVTVRERQEERGFIQRGNNSIWSLCYFLIYVFIYLFICFDNIVFSFCPTSINEISVKLNQGYGVLN